MQRDERRHRAERTKARVRRYFVCLDYTKGGERPTTDPARIGAMARTPHPCSCRGCGNRRRAEKGVARLTRQERRALVAAPAMDDEREARDASAPYS